MEEEHKKLNIYIIVAILFIVLFACIILISIVWLKNGDGISGNKTNTTYIDNLEENDAILKPKISIKKTFTNYDEYVNSCNELSEVEKEIYEKIIKRENEYWDGLSVNYSEDFVELENCFTESCWYASNNYDVKSGIHFNTFGTSSKINDISVRDIDINSHEDVMNFLTSSKFAEFCVSINEEIITTSKVYLWPDDETEKDYYSNVAEIAIINGNAKNDELWEKNNRVKKLKLTIDDEKIYILELDDTKEMQIFDINYRNKTIADEIKFDFEILEEYKGTDNDVACLTSICPIGGSNINWGSEEQVKEEALKNSTTSKTKLTKNKIQKGSITPVGTIKLQEVRNFYDTLINERI